MCEAKYESGGGTSAAIIWDEDERAQAGPRRRPGAPAAPGRRAEPPADPAAAAEVFTERGLQATLDDVARQAGVGVGTVYRRFPDKEALVDALFEERLDALVAEAEQASGEPDSWAGLVSFLEHAAEMIAGDRGLRAAPDVRHLRPATG